MGSFADYLENKVMDHVFSATTFTPPSTLYVGLSKTTITDAGGNITEPTGGSYARVAVTNNTTNFPTASGGSKTNGADWTFPTASADWGTVTDFFIADTSTGGNIIVYGALTNSKTVANGDVVKFLTGSLTLTLS